MLPMTMAGVEMFKEQNFSYHVPRSKMETFIYDTCVRCKETVVTARMRDTQRNRSFDPKPTGGSEIDPVYTQHTCRTFQKADEPSGASLRDEWPSNSR